MKYIKLSKYKEC